MDISTARPKSDSTRDVTHGLDIQSISTARMAKTFRGKVVVRHSPTYLTAHKWSIGEKFIFNFFDRGCPLILEILGQNDQPQYPTDIYR